MSEITNYLSARDATSTDYIHASRDRVFNIGESFASRASNAADGVFPVGVIPENAYALSVWFQPQSSQAGSATNYADVKVLNLGTAGSGTAVLASKSFSATGASIAANAPSSLPVVTAVGSALSAGQGIGVSYASAGNGIAIVAHRIQVAYRMR